MSDASILLPVTADERLARFVLHSKWVRKSDNTMREEAFIPHPYPDLSVFRHTGISETTLWQLGQDVAALCAKTLYGRADIQASDVVEQAPALQFEPTPTPRNHVNIIGWPSDKPNQKIIALKLAAKARYVPKVP